MLILSRKIGETLIIDGEIKVIVLDTKGNQVRLGIIAPKEVVVNREEIHKRIQDAKNQETQKIANGSV
jgi:carbon storage regulator